jgi:hypothetical protein
MAVIRRIEVKFRELRDANNVWTYQVAHPGARVVKVLTDHWKCILYVHDKECPTAHIDGMTAAFSGHERAVYFVQDRGEPVLELPPEAGRFLGRTWSAPGAAWMVFDARPSESDAFPAPGNAGA